MSWWINLVIVELRNNVFKKGAVRSAGLSQWYSKYP